MTIQEIHELRREGKFKEALSEAEKLYSNFNNSFTGKALFWVLSDFLKSGILTKELYDSFYLRILDLFEKFGKDDEYMNNAMKRMNHPFHFALRKNLYEAKSGIDTFHFIEKIREDYILKNPRNLFSNDIGWLIYYTLKNQEEGEIEKRKILLKLYFDLQLHVPSALHSCVLHEALKLLQDLSERNSKIKFNFLNFMKLWGIENLRDEDWQQEKNKEGFFLPSLTERLISSYAKILKREKISSSEDFMQLVEKSINRFPKNINLPEYKATALVSQGKIEEARKYYISQIQKLPSRYYLWSYLSDLVAETDTKIGLIAKAISITKNEDFVCGLRLKLVYLLMEKGLEAEAKFELDKYEKYYKSKGWKLKRDFFNLKRRFSINGIPKDPRYLYQQFIPLAEASVYSDSPEYLSMLIAKKEMADEKTKRKNYIWTLKLRDSVLFLSNPKKYGLDGNLQIGSILMIRLPYALEELPSNQISKANSPQVLKATVIDLNSKIDVDWIKIVKGPIKIQANSSGQKYAKIKGIFIPEKLLNTLPDRILAPETIVNVRAYLTEDKFWRAVAVSGDNQGLYNFTF